VISVHILCLDDCFLTTIMSQPTEITQFIFGRPLSQKAFEGWPARTYCAMGRLFGQLPGRNKLKAGSRLLV
jgi:hypothetical protein